MRSASHAGGASSCSEQHGIEVGEEEHRARRRRREKRGPQQHAEVLAEPRPRAAPRLRAVRARRHGTACSLPRRSALRSACSSSCSSRSRSASKLSTYAASRRTLVSPSSGRVCGHLVVAAVCDRRANGVEVAAVQPGSVREIRRAEQRIASCVGAVAGGAQRCEAILACGDPVFRRLAAAQAHHVRGNFVHACIAEPVPSAGITPWRPFAIVS